MRQLLLRVVLFGQRKVRAFWPCVRPTAADLDRRALWLVPRLFMGILW